MTSDAATAEVFDELLGWEQCNLASRLVESTVFISDAAVQDADLLQRMATASREHCRSLANAVMRAGGVPGLRHCDTMSGDLHFQELHHLLPRLVADRDRLVDAYSAALQRLAGNSDASTLVSRILEHHREELRLLQTLHGAGDIAAAPSDTHQSV